MALRSWSVFCRPLPSRAPLTASARRSQFSTSCWSLSTGPAGEPPMSWTQLRTLSDPQDFLDRGSFHELFDVLLELEAVRRGDGVQVVGELEEGVGRARVLRLVEASVLAHAPGDRTQHRVGHAGEVAQGLVPVLAGSQVHLSHGVEPNHLQDVYHDPGLHGVSGEERDRREQLPVGDEFTGERLHEAGELGVEEVEERLGRELRDPAAAVQLHRLVTLEGTPVGRLDVTYLGHFQNRAEDAVDELRPEVLGVGVDVHHEVAMRHGERAPHGVALAVRAAVVAHQLVLRVDLGAPGGGHFSRAVRGVRVDGQDLVHQRMVTGLPVYVVDLIYDPAHGVGHVAAGQHRADREAELAFAAGQGLEVRKLPVVVGAMLKPLYSVHGHHTPYVHLHITAPVSYPISWVLSILFS